MNRNNQNDLSNIRTTFATFLLDSREKLGYDRNQVSQRLGVAEKVIEEWECGKRPIDLVELRAYCQAIDLPLDECIAFLDTISEEVF